MKQGKLIVLYGINNLGKTTQAKILVDNLHSIGEKAEYLKYAIYNLEPSGTLLNEYLRKGNPLHLTAREFQFLQVLNRWQYQPKLEKILARGVNVVAEDYIGTGIAWGIANGVDESLMKSFATGLLEENLAFVFTGQRFNSGIESNHKHEQNSELLRRAEEIHLRLAGEYSWIRVNSNRSVPEISDEIFERVKLLY